MRPPQAQPRRSALSDLLAQLFPGLLGLWLALALIKFGNPVILDRQIALPGSGLEALLQPWPVAWGLGFFVVLFLCGLPSWRWSQGIRALAVLPALWFGWQCLSSLFSVRSDLTRATLPHFLVCTGCFYLGLHSLSHVRRLQLFWLGVAGGWVVVVAIGWRQHFGGLAELREFFYSLPDWREQPAELITKLASNRIYSTLIYPNALAGAMLLYTPVILAGAWELTRRRPAAQRAALVSLPLVGAVGCLVWSGSKAGWLIGLILVVVAGVFWIRLPARRGAWVWIGVLAILGLGLGGFWLRHRDYFARGATSVSARFDYWTVAASNAMARPLAGSGPGTFLQVYRHAKPADAEMTRLAHNDYLQQFSDSGVAGGALYVAMIGGCLTAAFRQRKRMTPMWVGIWLGVLGFALQGFTEFGLYIPAVAWPWFLALGGLLGMMRGLKTVDKPPGSS